MFSIIIPSLNNIDYLKICINSLKKNSIHKHQIIVHVNIGSDGTKKFLKSENISFTSTDHNVGLCKAVNLASKKSTYDYIMYSHDDFYFCPEWDKAILDEIKKIKHKNFYLSSTQVNTFGVNYFDCGNDHQNFSENKLLSNIKKYDFNDLQGSTWAPHIVHKDLWIKTGGFSEEFFPGAGSDPDFALKLWKSGVRIFKMLGSSKVYHFESKTLRDKKKFIYFSVKDLGSKSSKIFLVKWGMSIKFFRKYYLRANSLYNGALNEPPKSISYILELLICKIKLLYINFFFKK
jgi:GT2 family glycosyltransferase|tara:strand:- start:2027 stop:2896 length:870 start_codon:yes stop_codon:yes gene_type:complete